jgi:DNA-binding NarL/FixJ family response regulator
MAIKLTKKEQAILDSSFLGYSVKQLANEFEVRPQQIKRHLSSIYHKKGVSCRVELMAKEILRLHNEIRMMND